MPKVDIPEFGLKGLNTDLPSFVLPLENFSDGINIRSSNNRLSAVPSFVSFSSTFTALNKIYKGAQWTPAGSSFYNIAVVGNKTSDNSVKAYIDFNGTATTLDFPSILDATMGADDPDLFVFNEVLIGNFQNNRPMFSAPNASTQGDFAFIPNWLPAVRTSNTTATAVVSGSSYYIATATSANWSSVGGSSTAVVGDTFLCTTTNSNISSLGAVSPAIQVFARKMAQYNGRLIAMNLYGGATEPITLSWSSPISNIASLAAVKWSSYGALSDGDDLITDTAGKLIDGGQLGQYFIAYKEDAVVRYRDTGSPFFLVPEVAFADDGLFSANCFVEIEGNRHVVLGNRGVYIHNGGPEKENISKGIVEGDLYASINPAHKDRTFLFRESEDKEVWICYSTPSNSGDGCNQAHVYNYQTSTWYKRSLPDVNDIAETEIAGTYIALAFKPSTSSVFKIGPALESTGHVSFQMNTMGDTSATKNVSAVYPKCLNTLKLGIQGTSNAGGSGSVVFAAGKEFNPLTQYKHDTRVNGRFISLKLEMVGGISPEISGIEVDVEAGGLR
jgi:hypothetical protein